MDYEATCWQIMIVIEEVLSQKSNFIYTINISKTDLNSINVIKITLAVFDNLIDQSFEYTYTLF